jgi:quinolinate synthase
MVNTVVSPPAGASIDATLLAGHDLEGKIHKLRRERNAVILAHYYQDEEIQDLADFVGDSLDLSRQAASTKANVILFCGVRFMAEVAKIVAPEKTVLLPDADAGCSLEESCRPEPFKRFREQHPDHIAVTYINCSAEVKALSDVIVTSSNAEAILRQLPADRPILFAPDRHLGAYLQHKTGRKMTLWPGSCIVHEQFSERELIKLKSQHPNAPVASHPECPEGILLHSDFVGSTSAILKFVNESPANEFIIGTEQHIIHQMQRHLRQTGAPPKIFHSLPGVDGTCNCSRCPFMAKNTLEKVYLALVNNAPRIELPEPLRLAALKPLERMLEMSKGIGFAQPQ